MALDKLLEKIVYSQNPTVAGLDPRIEYVPPFLRDKAYKKYGANLKGAAKALLSFNTALIDALCDVVPAVKLQAAYYELLGYHGVKTLKKTIDYAKSKGLYVITDGKRNDIGATMEAYASAHLGSVDISGHHVGDNSDLEPIILSPFDADALTVNPYLGKDGIKPLFSVCKQEDKGIFVLVKTSNPSSGDLQDIVTADGRKVYEIIGDYCENEWGPQAPGKYGYSGVGAVVGATYPEQLAELRARLPRTFFLIPGYGAQGGTAADISLAYDKNGLGGIVNNSRGIMCAWQKSTDLNAERNFAVLAREEALRMRDDLIRHIGVISLPGRTF